MDDTFGITQKNNNNNAHTEFINILNEIDAKISFACEIEVNSRIPFLETLVIREKDGSLSTTVYRKPSHTGLTINPQSSQNLWLGVFKGALSRAYKLCSNELLLKKEIDFLIKNFEDNGYNRKKLYRIAQTYKPKKSDPPMKTGYNLRSKNKQKAKIKKNQKIRSILYGSQYLTSHI